jgi:hypothetical protein
MFGSLGRLEREKKLFSITKYRNTKHAFEVLHSALRVKGKPCARHDMILGILVEV